MMKKIFLLVLTLLLAAALCSCSWLRSLQREEESVPSAAESRSEPEPQPEPDSATPDGAVAELFESAKAWDTEAINEYLPAGVDVGNYVPAELQGSLQQVLDQVDYEIGRATIDGDTATVEVTVTAVDAESAMSDAIAAAAAHVVKSQLTGKEVSYIDAARVALEAIDIPSLPSKTTTAQAYMVRDGDEWKLDTSDKNNTPLLNAASGGMVDLYGKFKELADTYGIELTR